MWLLAWWFCMATIAICWMICLFDFVVFNFKVHVGHNFHYTDSDGFFRCVLTVKSANSASNYISKSVRRYNDSASLEKLSEKYEYIQMKHEAPCVCVCVCIKCPSVHIISCVANWIRIYVHINWYGAMWFSFCFFSRTYLKLKLVHFSRWH